MAATKHKKSTQLENGNKTVSAEIVRETETIFKHSLVKREHDHQQLARELVDYVTNEDTCISILHFLVAHKLVEKTFYDWVDKSPDLRIALDYARQVIGVRRQNKLSSGEHSVAFLPYLSIYCNEYKKHAEWRASLFQRKDEEPTVRVIIDPIESSEMVKIKAGVKSKYE